MANVFEQLENLDSVSEPRQAFEDIITSMLLDCGYTDGRVKVFVGDGGIDAFKGMLAKKILAERATSRFGIPRQSLYSRY